MNFSWYCKSILAICTLLGATLKADEATVSRPTVNLTEDSLVLFCLDNNTIYIEQYPLQELKEDLNYFSAREYAEQCLCAVDMSERGAHVHEVQMIPQEPHKLRIMVRKEQETTMYILNWLELVSEGQIDASLLIHVECDAYLRGSKRMRSSLLRSQLAPICAVFCRESFAKDDKQWLALVGATWRADNIQHSTNFVFDRMVKSACGVIIPQHVSALSLKYPGVVAKKTALNEGFMWQEDNEKALEEDQALVLSEADIEVPVAEEQHLVQQAVEDNVLVQQAHQEEVVSDSLFAQLMHFVYNLFSW